jgi:hypothetical protein
MRSLPIACEPGAFGSKESFAEHLAEGRRLIAASIERRELDEGWALRLPNTDESLLAFVRWSAAERRCCPFFTFGIERAPDPGPLWVRITGPDPAKTILTEALT